MIIDYTKGIHPLSGKEYNIENDIIITPFWTETFCEELCNAAEFYKDKFYNHYQLTNYYGDKGDISFNILYLDLLNRYLFEDFTDHYARDISSILNKEWPANNIKGWFPPFIVKYQNDKNDKIELHTDVSDVTLVVKLNDNFEGGRLEFPRQNWNNDTVPVGYAQIWPSTITHPHRVTPVSKGTRYVFTSWTWPHSFQPDGIQWDINRHNPTKKSLKELF